MDVKRLDAYVRFLPFAASRRAALALGLVAWLNQIGGNEAEAKKKKKRKKKQTCPPPPPPTPPPPPPPSLTCGARTVQCGQQCLGACPSGQALDPGACDCCLVNAQPCSGQPLPCCSGVCQNTGITLQCIGIENGQACRFDAQCASGNCAGGVCVA